MGSKTGWILALGLVIVVLGALYFVILEPLPSLPGVTREPGFLDLKMVNVPLAEVIGFRPTEPGNAADDYQKAVQLWITHGAEIDAVGDAERQDALAASDSPWTDPAMKACREIAAHVANGARKEKMEYSWLYTPKRVRVGFHHDHATKLFKVAVAVHLLHMIHRDRKEYAEAEKLLKDMLVLGVHMLDERVFAHVSMEGVEIQTSAVQRLQQLYDRWPDAPRHRLKALGDYESTLRLISENVRRKKRILWDSIPATDPVTRKPLLAPGDVFNIAENDRDRAWRVQAILTLGPLKYRISGRGDVLKTTRLIQQFRLSKDPLVAAAAKAADEMTLEEFRQMGTDFGEEEEPE